MDDSSNCSSTPRQATTPPPSTSSTTRNSLAWLAAGAPVDFTREVNQQTTTDQSAEERNSHASSETGETGAISQGHKDSVGTNFEVNESSLKAPPRKLRKQRPPKRKAVTYPSSALPVQREPLQSTSAVAVPPSDIETCTHSAAAIHPILANAIITKSNPRGPRKRNWCAALRKQLWWFIPVNIVFSVAFTFYFIYQDKIAAGTNDIRQWLAAQAVWSWSVPTAILIVLSCPPFFFIPLLSEIMQFLVGLTYPLWIAIGIASLSTVLGDGVLFLIFKYAASEWVWRRCEERPSWAAIARVSEESGFRGVLMIRFSIVPPSLANPIFATTGMSLWLYIITIVISLPKQIVLVILGYPSTKDNKGATVAKIIAISGFVIVTIWGTFWLRRQLRIAKDAIQAERNEALAEELRKQVRLAAEQLEKTSR